MGREIRRVPAGWKHPKDWENEFGEVKEGYRPLLQGDFKEDYAEWERELKEWFLNKETWPESYIGYKGVVEPADAKYAKKTWEQYAGGPSGPPNPYDYMPTGDWYQLYETVSEGTPLSPPFPEKKLLVDWLSDNKDYWGHTWTPEQAEAMVRDEYAPSMIMQNGKIYTSEESVLL